MKSRFTVAPAWAVMEWEGRECESGQCEGLSVPSLHQYPEPGCNIIALQDSSTAENWVENFF
jgi:hypothetical protein